MRWLSGSVLDMGLNSPNFDSLGALCYVLEQITLSLSKSLCPLLSTGKTQEDRKMS